MQHPTMCKCFVLVGVGGWVGVLGCNWVCLAIIWLGYLRDEACHETIMTCSTARAWWLKAV
jgi:hypothetical protein